MKQGAVLMMCVFLSGILFAGGDMPIAPTEQETAKTKALEILKYKIEEEKANFTIRHYFNLVVGENVDAWPMWETKGIFYRTFISPHVPKENLSFGLEGSPQAAMLFDGKPLVLAKVSTEEQEATLSEVVFEAEENRVKITRKLFDYEVTVYEGTKNKRTSKKVVTPTIFKTTTGAKVKKTIRPNGTKQTIVAYTQPGVYTPVMETYRRVSQDFPGAVLYDYVYFNQGDALHRTLGSQGDLGKKELIGTMQASGGCARLGSKEASVAREKIKSVGLERSRVQVVETEDILSCVGSEGATYTLYLSSDRTSGVLIGAKSEKPVFVGLRGETSWKASDAGRKILLSSMPKILETTVEELPKIEISYLTLQDKSPFKAFGKEYSLTLQKQVLSLNVTSKFKFEELSSFIKNKEEVKESQLSLNCKKTN
jgi:hypothetical protein